MPWLTWRARAIAALYTEMGEAAQAASPGSELAVVTPGLESGPAGNEARRVDRAGLAPSQAWRSVGLDLQTWPSAPAALPVFRGVELSTDALGRDLATSPDLDALVAARSQRGLFLTIHDGCGTAAGASAMTHDAQDETSGIATTAGSARSLFPRGSEPIRLTALPLGDGPGADELLGHAVAALDARWVFLDGKAVAGQEERLRRFSTVLRAAGMAPHARRSCPGRCQLQAVWSRGAASFR